MNLDQVFRQQVDAQPDHPAIIGPARDAALTYAELDAEIESVSQELKRIGVKPGDCVGLHLRSGLGYIISNYAVWRAGGCVVPIPFELQPAEQEEIVRGISLQFLVDEKRSAGGVLDQFRAGDATDLPRDQFAFAISSPRTHPKEFQQVNAAFIRFTSGTTGSSKGVVLSHETIRDRIHAANEVLQLGPDDRVVWLLSMSYHFAVSIVGYLSLGATIMLLPNHFAAAIADAIQRLRGTFIYGSPMHYEWLSDYQEAVSLDSVRMAVSTTTGLDRLLAARFQERFDLPLTQALGIIEVGLPCINVDFAASRGDAVGRVLPAYEIRLDDIGLDEHHQAVSFRGPGFLDAYYDPWQPCEQIMPGGWFRSGDVGELDEDGCLYLRGRSTDVINVGGMKFFPKEVEAVLNSHPGVEEACVVAEQDDRLGDLPVAHVVAASPRPTEEQLIDLCREQLAIYKVPQRVEFVTELERTASGKILHRSR